MTKKKTYTPAPEVPSELQPRYKAILEVLSGTTTVAEAARRLGMARNHFQTLMHRSLEGMIGALVPGKPGRPSKPSREVELEAERDKALRKVQQLEERLDMTTRLMGLASELMKGSAPRSRAKKRSTPMTKADEESEEPPRSLRELAHQLTALKLPSTVVARHLGVAASTFRRWSATPEKSPVRRSQTPTQEAVRGAIEDVRALRGLVGAESLRRSHQSLSRRQAAQVKRETLTAMERERRDGCARVVVTVPGVLRGFDAMERGHAPTPRYVLIAADGCVPFRTSTKPVTHYDDDSVARVLGEDFTQHGAPLVVRLDRAKAHRAPKTSAVLAAHQVLVLHGPAHYPLFYGQLERQNREHAAWVHIPNNDIEEPFEERMDAMRHALNVRWRRRALDWKTPEEVWQARPIINVDRRELHAFVADTARRLQRDACDDKMTEDLATRLAIKQALVNLGYLKIEIRKPVLGDIELRQQAI